MRTAYARAATNSTWHRSMRSTAARRTHSSLFLIFWRWWCARRPLVAVVTPQVLRWTRADETLEVEVDLSCVAFGLAAQRRRQRLEPDAKACAFAATSAHALAEDEQHDR